MFAVYCPQHERRVLLGPRSIESLANTPEGIVVRWRCPCGGRGTLHTGRSATEVGGAVADRSAA